jgi:purine nucleosidase
METLRRKKKVIIDTDAGIDDAMAITLALLHPEVEVIAITCVFGNIAVDSV